MKIAVIYNRESKKVINLFGQPNRERYGLAAIRRIVNALKKGGHQVQSFEGDKDLIDRLEEFMPRTLVEERQTPPSTNSGNLCLPSSISMAGRSTSVSSETVPH